MAGEISLKTPATGLVTLSPANTATDKTITIPATTGTMLVQDGTNTTTITNLNYTGTLTGSTGVINIGSGQVYKDASGNVGIGTSSPTVRLTSTAGVAVDTISALFTQGASDPNFRAGFANGSGGSINTEQAKVGMWYSLNTTPVCHIGFLRADAATSLGMSFNINGTERARVSNDGFLVTDGTLGNTYGGLLKGYGVTGQGGYAELGVLDAGTYKTGVLVTEQAKTVQLHTNGSERMRIDSSGNVGIGTSSFNYSAGGRGLLEVNGSSTALIGLKTGNTARGYLYTQGTDMIAWAETGNFTVGTFAAANVSFITNNTERMRVANDGSIRIGSSSAQGNSGAGSLNLYCTGGDAFNINHQVNGNYVVNISQVGTTATRFFSFIKNGNDVGNIYCTTTNTAYNTTSDYRLKENVQPMQGALATVAQLNPVTYTWKTDGSAGQGFIAHELQAVVPDAVTGQKDAVDKDGKPVYQGVDTSFLVATLTAAIQELTARLEVLENK